MAVLDFPKLLTREQAAEFLGIRPQTLAVWAVSGRYSLPCIKVGRSVRYRREALEAFLQLRTGTNSRQIAAAGTL